MAAEDQIAQLKARIQQLERSHDELRGALIAAARHIRKYRHKPEHAKMRWLLWRTLKDARAVRRDLLGWRTQGEDAGSQSSTQQANA